MKSAHHVQLKTKQLSLAVSSSSKAGGGAGAIFFHQDGQSMTDTCLSPPRQKKKLS